MEQIQKKISTRFSRSFSFPVPSVAGNQFLPVKSRSATTAAAAALFATKHASYKHRSVSLPARLHPIISQIETQIHSLRSWHHSSTTTSSVNSPAWIISGLSGIETLNSSLASLLHHPQSQISLSFPKSLWFPRLLEDSLRFADVHSVFRSSILALSDLLPAARSALRRRDDAGFSAALRDLKRIEKRMLKIAASARGIGRWGSGDTEVGGVAREVTAVTAVASAAVFAGTAMVLSAAIAGVSRGAAPACVVGAMLWRSAAFRRRMEEEGEGWREAAMGRMEMVEKCVSELEICCERVLRGVMNTRVFLLNAQTPLL